MLLFHSTPGVNSYSIYSQGVTIETARLHPQKIFLHTWRKRKWARLHLAVRYKCDPRQITSFAVDVSRSDLRKFGRGLWTCDKTIFPSRVVGQTFFLNAKELSDATIFGYDFDLFSAPGQLPALSKPAGDEPRQP